MSELATKICFIHDRVYEPKIKGSGTLVECRRTIAMACDGEGKVHAGIARCHRNDRFSRKIGREIAKARLEQTPFVFSDIEQFRLRFGTGVTEFDPKTGMFSFTPDEHLFSLVKKFYENNKNA